MKGKVDKIRTATFTVARKGYEQREVEEFLDEVAEWLESGGADEARQEIVQRDLARVGERTARILTEAETSAESTRTEAEREAAETVRQAKRQAKETRERAEGAAKKMREEADAYSASTREDAERKSREMIEGARAKAQRIVEEGEARRKDLETVIADLATRRDEVIAGIDRLRGTLGEAADRHRAGKDGDRFARPERLDPAERKNSGAAKGAAAR